MWPLDLCQELVERKKAARPDLTMNCRKCSMREVNVGAAKAKSLGESIREVNVGTTKAKVLERTACI